MARHSACHRGTKRALKSGECLGYKEIQQRRTERSQKVTRGQEAPIVRVFLVLWIRSRNKSLEMGMAMLDFLCTD